jgi:hypothetical protein
MPELAHVPCSYREDPGVAAFDDSRALFVFDGVCVICSGGAAFVMRHDRHARVNFTPARSTLGQTLFRHYAVNWNETYPLVGAGRAYTASAGYLRLCTVLGAHGVTCGQAPSCPNGGAMRPTHWWRAIATAGSARSSTARC